MSAPTDIVHEDELRMVVPVPDHTLQRVIGRGSYGEVWEARNVMGTPRAVKVVRRQDFDSARPFEREFEGIQRYEPVSRSHAGLVQVLHVGRDAEGSCFYYVMELADDAAVAGTDYIPRTLRGELQRRKVLPVEECIEIGISLASALGHLHRAGLVHRDVKPSNIIFVDGVAKLADVGLVARLSDSRSMVGTEGYFAPEGTGQPRSDVFSLGKVLYECVTGQDRLSFPDVPESWSSGSDNRAAFEFMEIVLRAAESDPDRRYDGTDEMLADLALLKAGKSLRYLRRMETRLKRTLQVLAFSALAIAVAGGAWWYERHRADQIEAAEKKASRAQAETNKLLGESLIAEARAVRLSRLAGSRAKALDAVRRGLEAGASITELRTQAASALALTDAGNVDPDRGIAAWGNNVAWSPDGTLLVLTDRVGGRTRILDRTSGTELHAFDTRPHAGEVSVSAGARRIAVLHGDASVTLWDTANGRMIWALPPAKHACRPSFSADGSWIVCATDQGIAARSCDGGDTVILYPDARPLRGIHLAPNGKWIAALPEPVESADGKTKKDLGFRIYTGLPGPMPRADQAARVKEDEIESDIRLEGASISGDSRFLAAAVSEDRLRVWEIPTLSQIGWVRGHQRTVRGTAFHPYDSNIVASTSWDGTTRLWDMSTRQEIMVIPAGGEEILMCPERGEILLRGWDRQSMHTAPFSARTALRVLNIPAQTRLGLFANVCWNHDGSLLAAAGDSGVIVWDTASGQPFSAQAASEAMEWRNCIFHPADGSLYFSGRSGLFRRTVTRGENNSVTFGPKESILPGFASFLKWSGDHLAVSGRFDEQRRGGVTLLSPDGQQRHFASSQLPDQLGTSPDGRWIAVARYPNGGGTIFDMSASPPAGHDVETRTRADFNFSADSRVLIIGTEKEITFTRPENSAEVVAPPLPRTNVQEIPSHSAISADLIAVSTGPTEITLCHGRTFAPILKLDSSLTPFDASLSFSPDGKRLALAGGTSRTMVWDIAWIKEELTKMGLGW
jgi:WD40 repeat protein